MLQIQADALKTLISQVGNSLLVHRLSHASKMVHCVQIHARTGFESYTEIAIGDVVAFARRGG